MLTTRRTGNSVLGFYKDEKDRHSSICPSCINPVVVPIGGHIPFQIETDYISGNFCVTKKNECTGNITPVDAQTRVITDQLSGKKFLEVRDYAMPTAGSYSLILQIGTDFLYSDTICVQSQETYRKGRPIVLRWRNTVDIFPNFYANDFQQQMYLNVLWNAPTYQIQEEAKEDGYGNQKVSLHKRTKTYSFDVIASDNMLDAFYSISSHDTRLLLVGGVQYEISNISIALQNQDCFQILTFSYSINEDIMTNNCDTIRKVTISALSSNCF